MKQKHKMKPAAAMSGYRFRWQKQFSQPLAIYPFTYHTETPSVWALSQPQPIQTIPALFI